MDPTQIILTIAAIRASTQLLADLGASLQVAYGITDAQIEKAKADATAAHNQLQKTP